MRLLITALLAVVIAGGAAWYLDLWDPMNVINGSTKTTNGPVDPPDTTPAELGDLLYPAQDDPPEKDASPSLTKDTALVIPNCQLVVSEKEKIASPREGILLFIGDEITQEDPNKPGLSYPTVTIMQGNEEILVKAYRKWKEGEIIKPGQMLALVNPALAMKEVAVKQTQVLIAQQEYQSAVATEGEAHNQYKTELKLPIGVAASQESINIKKLMWDRQKYEAKAKEQAIKIAQTEAEKAQIVLQEHVIISKMKGTAIIKYIFKNDNGSVRALEDIVELHNIEELRAEGTIGVQHRNKLKVGAKVTLEPVYEEAPHLPLTGHTLDVTSVAFSNPAQGDPYVVSGSMDRTVAVWTTSHKYPKHVWHHPADVRVVACTPQASGNHWCLSGCSDGSLRLWDLNKLSGKEPMWTVTLPGGSGVGALAFSPDGKFFAVGADDNSIHIYQTTGDEGKPKHLYQIGSSHPDAHQGSVTSVQFTPQCRLVSAAKDNTLRVWKLHEKGAKLDLPVISNRGGAVSVPGVSQDGQWMLFDKGKELFLRSVADGKTRGMLQNPLSTSFETLALLSPDPAASLLLTAGAPEGRLQLWKSPVHGARPYEVRQFVPTDRMPVTAAAFAPGAGGPQDSFAVTGAKEGYLYLWKVPGHNAVKNHPIQNLELDVVDQSIEGGTQVRIAITVPNPVSAEFPTGKLTPGGTVHVVIE
jgi:WD40 repeat protein